jgi:hypothetical protein
LPPGGFGPGGSFLMYLVRCCSSRSPRAPAPRQAFIAVRTGSSRAALAGSSARLRCIGLQSGAGLPPTDFHSAPAGGQLSPEPAALKRSTAAAHSAASAALAASCTRSSARNRTSVSLGSPAAVDHQTTSSGFCLLAAFAEPADDAHEGGHQRQKTPENPFAPGISGLGPDVPVLSVA